MNLLDFRQDPVYKAKTEPEAIEVPNMLFAMVDGKGAPDAESRENSEFQEAKQILYSIVRTIKTWDKVHHVPPRGYTHFSIAPVEGLWWTRNGHLLDLDYPEDWNWSAMIRLPEFVTPEFFQQVVSELGTNEQSAIYTKAHLQHFNEGKAVQIMHVGPYDQEEKDKNRMLSFARDGGYELRGRYHEVYFGDPGETSLEELKTIIRYPVKEHLGVS
jgi:hypothetical protein